MRQNGRPKRQGPHAWPEGFGVSGGHGVKRTGHDRQTTESSARRPKLLVPDGEELSVWPLRAARRDDEQLVALELLQTVPQHRTVGLLEDVMADLDYEVRPDADDLAIEGCVVQLADASPFVTTGSPRGWASGRM